MRFSGSLLIALAVGLLLFGVGGCVPSHLKPFTAVPSVRGNPNPAAPLAAIVRFSTDRPVSTQLHISGGGRRTRLTFDERYDPRKGLPVVGLLPGCEHTIQVSVSTRRGAGITYPTLLKYTTPLLPTDPAEFPKIVVERADKSKIEPGVTMFNPRRRIPGGAAGKFNKEFGLLTAVDSEGRVVWYYRGDSRISDFAQMPNGNIVFITQDNRLVEIDMLGNTLRTWCAKGRREGPGEGTPVDTLTFHHCVEPLSNGNFIILGSDRREMEYYTSEHDPKAPMKKQWVMGDEIVEFQPDGKVVWRWNAFDHLNPMRFGYLTLGGYWARRGWPGTADWTHCNSVRLTPEGDAVLLNSRYQSAVLKIRRGSGEIVWLAGEPSGWPKALQNRLLRRAAGTKWFWHQHAPEITPDGTLMLFDNDNFRNRPYGQATEPKDIRSRAVEFKIDEAEKTIRQIWSSDHPKAPQLASWAMGSARVMPKTGNVLAGYGLVFRNADLPKATWATRLKSTGTTEIREYSRTEPAKLLWRLQLLTQDPKSPVGWSLYGARRIRF